MKCRMRNIYIGNLKTYIVKAAMLYTLEYSFIELKWSLILLKNVKGIYIYIYNFQHFLHTTYSNSDSLGPLLACQMFSTMKLKRFMHFFKLELVLYSITIKIKMHGTQYRLYIE